MGSNPTPRTTNTQFSHGIRGFQQIAAHVEAARCRERREGVYAALGLAECGERLPVHVGFIPDGNRRWARMRGLEPWEGHLRGYQVARRILDELWEAGVRYVSFYGLSRENCLRRPRGELEALHKLLAKAAEDLASDPRVEQGRVRVFFAGDFSLLPGWLAEALESLNAGTRGNGPMALVVAACYSAAWEAGEAARRAAEAGAPPGELLRYSPLSWLPPLDLVVRTGGERRLSGFLLFHAAYAELYFTDALWPDFSPAELCLALRWYSGRERRFGR